MDACPRLGDTVDYCEEWPCDLSCRSRGFFRYALALVVRNARQSPACFAWWWPGTASCPTLKRGSPAGVRTCIPAWCASNWRSDVGRSRVHCAFRVRLAPLRLLRIFHGRTAGHNILCGDRRATVDGDGSTLDTTETCTESRSRS